MASSSRKDYYEIDKEDDGQKRNITSSNFVGTSECGDPEKQESGVRDEDLTAGDCWSVFCFVGLCCSSASSNPNFTSSPLSSSSWYHSARIQRMMEKRGEFSTDVESEIEASKVHWSEVDPTVSQPEHSGKTNREWFELLKRRKYVREGDQIVFEQCNEIYDSLFEESDDNGLLVGEKIAEGGQADIYEACYKYGDWVYVVKVFKAGSLLQDLEKQWPLALLKLHQRDDYDADSQWGDLPVSIEGATLLKDERLLDRFAFVMPRCWGDLRKLIDQQMMQYSLNQGPPFSPKQVLHLMYQIAKHMRNLHGQHPPILHNDLKAANVLVHWDIRTEEPYLDMNRSYMVTVADFECSVGVVGTGLWRAPEILQQLKDRVLMPSLKFTDKCDVYSYGMPCYEIVTGRLPFEDHLFSEGRDLVLIGETKVAT